MPIRPHVYPGVGGVVYPTPQPAPAPRRPAIFVALGVDVSGMADVSGQGAITATGSDAGAVDVSGTATLTEVGAEFEGFAVAGQSSMAASGADAGAAAVSGTATLTEVGAEFEGFAVAGQSTLTEAGATASALNVAGGSDLAGSGADSGAADVSGGSDLTALSDYTPPEPVPISIIAGGPSWAHQGGARGLRHRETIERWLDEAIEDATRTKGRPAKKATARETPPKRTITATQRRLPQPAPVSDAVAAALASAQAKESAHPAPVRPHIGAGAVAGESRLAGAGALVGSGWVEGSSDVSGSGWLDHENSEDEMHALMLALV